jgi:hypothetical protein
MCNVDDEGISFDDVEEFNLNLNCDNLFVQALTRGDGCDTNVDEVKDDEVKDDEVEDDEENG